jgi:hypothetical protein
MSAPSTSLRKLFVELEQLFQTETEARVSTSVHEAERALAERLNQAVRRLRQATSFDEVSAILTDTCTPFCNGCAVFHVSENEVTASAAFSAVIESGEPVTALCSPAQVSPVLIARFHHSPEDKAHLFPLTVRRKTIGVLYAAGQVESAAVELLAQSAGAVLESLEHPKPAAPPDLVRIEAAPAATPPADPEAMNLRDRTVHLQAQRFARVHVAEMRLYQAEAVKTGRQRGDLYAALQPSIDAARSAYRLEFLPAPGMADYLHQELVHTLANDNPATLGEKYPGPLV